MAKIGIVHIPFYSHIMAGNRLTRALIRLGHDVIAWAPEHCRFDLEAMGVEFRLHHPEIPQVQGWMAFVAEVTALTELHAQPLIEEFFDSELDLVFHDSQVPWARVAADYLGLPRIVSHPMFPIISPDKIPSRLDLEAPAPDPVEAEDRFEEGWLSISNRWGVEIEDIPCVVHSLAEHTVAFTTEEVLGDFGLPDGWRLIGPMMEPPRIAQPPGRDERPLVYVCFGTSFNARPELFTKVVAGLADEPFEVLISTGAGIVDRADLGPLPENVTVSGFVDQWEVLSRASVHITHGGCNSVHESLLAGVPMVCVPQAFDQFPLTHRVATLGAGVVANEDPRDIKASVRLLLASDKVRRIAARLSEHLRGFDGQSRLAGVLAEALDG